MSFRLAVETDTLSLCMDLARRGIGYTVVPACALFEHAYGGQMSWAPLRGLYMTWALCENQARSHSQAFREGRRLVFETVAEALTSARWFGAESASSNVTKLLTTRTGGPPGTPVDPGNREAAPAGRYPLQ